jgi:transglutaminase-like putative cysteine protease
MPDTENLLLRRKTIHFAALGLLVALSASGVSCHLDASPSAGTPPGEMASRAFEFLYEATSPEIPATAERAYLWIPYPAETAEQTLGEVQVKSELSYEVVEDPKYGNRALRFELPPGSSEEPAAVTFRVTRREHVRRPHEAPKPAQPIADPDLSLWLQPSRRVPLDDQIRTWAEQTVEGQTTPLGKARAIYDYAVTNLEYDKSGTGWGNGDIYWACDKKRGNCTDFHSVFIGYARSVGVPARFEMGFPIPLDRGEGEIGGYHCWAQFYLRGFGWVPLDASEANKNPEKREYFFGAHDENRVLFTVGRDISFPEMQGPPLNYFVYPYAESDGKPVGDPGRRFYYRDIEPS